ncbi:unnamed protein product [Musa acuminata subsp. malaccensis]|uniref:(wild Malaysian banana) hypothetical protein n=1 Tax=Musa acuminata subsp. malaccensis TaxID=214687 RepID=A0A804K550_MUSAM|nr:PREDICTED: transcription factor MYB108 [Musa acuminata subsp. malaccensis]CAG1831158.1 unnamed protein product [Musa acuminata subsp. malaccensis]
MEFHGRTCGSFMAQSEEEVDLRRGPWTAEEDLVLMNYVAAHGEGRWNSLARCSGLRRTGKSCRLRWLNYLRPDVRRGNITPEEQLLILQLHTRWGNRWSKIAQYLPGRTDNEIKNYWRTRVQKHAKQLRCDVNSKQFKDAMTYVWMPRLVERIRAASGVSTTAPAGPVAEVELVMKPSPEESSTPSSSFGAEFPPAPPVFDTFPAAAAAATQSGEGELPGWWSESGDTDLGLPDFDHSVWGDDLWSAEDIWLQQQL